MSFPFKFFLRFEEPNTVSRVPHSVSEGSFVLENSAPIQVGEERSVRHRQLEYKYKHTCLSLGCP